MSETDLRLFLVLDAVMTAGSVTRAAERLGLTQSAVSHALGRLRVLYKDELLVRGRAGMMPTPLAQAIIPSIRIGLAELERVLNREHRFDPSTTTRVFTIATIDLPVVVQLPRVVARLRAEAPQADIRVRAFGSQMIDQLETGQLDVVFAGGEVERPLALDRALMRARILSPRFECIVRADHPTVGDRLTLAQYCALHHVLVSTAGSDQGMVDAVLAERGLKRRVVVTVPYFVGAPQIVAVTDLIATVPEDIARLAQATLPIRRLKPPLPLPRGDAYLWWHQRFQNDPAHRWWRGVLLEACAQRR